LVEAVHDPDWHVRETALLALAKQGQHVPKEVLLTALHDTDASVREAATFALHWRNASVSSGKLWEQHTMQQDIHNTTNDNERRPPDEVVPSSTWNGSGESREGRGRSERFESEQMQEYVPQEFATYEFGGAMSPHQGKLVPRLHRPQWKWWIALLVVAIASFLLGSGISISMSVPKMGIVPSVVQLPQKGVPPAERPFPMNPKYAWIVQDDVAQGLHLAPQEIASRLRGGMSIVDIAASQGVSALELRAIELKAVSDLLNTAVKAGDIAPDQVGSWLKQFQANPQLLDKIVTALFLTNP
jgi:hypothetical protein